MPDKVALSHARLKTPKAAAIAGIIFSLLMFASFWLLRRSIPADPLDSGAWLAADTNTIALALNLVPFAGVAFLWFIGVLRDRLAQQEDRFFATVFFGSALLFLAMLFAAAAVIGAIMLVASAAGPNELASHLSLRARRRLHHCQRVCHQDGRRIYDHNVNRRDLYRHRSALDGLHWVPVGAGSSARQLLLQLEFRRIAHLGVPDQRTHPDGQSAQTLGRRKTDHADFRRDRLSQREVAASSVSAPVGL
jgi:hypothetical protein